MKINNETIIIALLTIIATSQLILITKIENNSHTKESGRYSYTQISQYRRDQYMLDKETGRLWEMVCVTQGKDPGSCEENILQPVSFQKDSPASTLKLLNLYYNPSEE